MRRLAAAAIMVLIGCAAEDPGPDAGGDFTAYCDDVERLREVINEQLPCGTCIVINCGDAGMIHHCTPGRFPDCRP